MKYLIAYFLVGAMMAVWSALNSSASRSELAEHTPLEKPVSMGAAYGLIAILWPLSFAVFVYALFVGLMHRERTERGR